MYLKTLVRKSVSIYWFCKCLTFIINLLHNPIKKVFFLDAWIKHNIRKTFERQTKQDLDEKNLNITSMSLNVCECIKKTCSD